MRHKHALLALILLFVIQLSAAPAKKKAPRHKNLTAQINEILAEPEMASASWGIDAVDLKSGKALFSLNPDHLFLPASNAKLATTAAALALIGPDYRFRTTVETTGKLTSDGHLQGDLVIVGRGDPNISGRVLPYALKSERLPPHTQILEDMADQVVRKGVKFVDGNVIGDDTFYAPERYGESWAQDDLQWIDGAPVSALTFNDNVIFLKILPGAQPGDKAVTTLEPQTDYYEIDNRIVTTAAGVPKKIGIHRDPGSKKVLVWGTVPVTDQEMTEALAVEDPAEFTAEIFKSLLQQRGVIVSGQAEARHGDIAQFFDQPPALSPPAPATSPAVLPSVTPPTATPSTADTQQVLAEHVSLPFLEDLRVTNKTSQNLHAELALRLLGKLKGTSGSFEAGRAVVKQFLVDAGIKEDEFYLLDGSGLSRRDLITPAAIVQLLIYASHQPWGAAYEDTLPVAGVDGSLSDRFVNAPAGGLVHAKTGTLNHVNALSGYGQTRKGRQFVFSIFCNNHDVAPASKVLAAIDAIVNAVVTEGDRVPGVSAKPKVIATPTK